jgi:hypothetical protein
MVRPEDIAAGPAANARAWCKLTGKSSLKTISFGGSRFSSFIGNLVVWPYHYYCNYYLCFKYDI